MRIAFALTIAISTLLAGGVAQADDDASAAPGAAVTTGASAGAPAHRDTDDVEQDSGSEPDRFEWLVLTADMGYRGLDLQKVEFDDDGGAHAKLIPATAGGLSPGLGLGVRLWFVSLMLRGDVTFMGDSGGAFEDDLELWNLDLEAAFRMTQTNFQPYLLVGVGYSALGGVGDVIDNARRAADANGANARFGLGFDYYLSELFTLGARAHVDGVLLAAEVSARELARAEKVDTLAETEARLRDADGTVAGLSYAAAITFGVHGL